jgi:hypothetical protein
VFASFIKSLIALYGFLPGSILSLHGLIQAGERVGFDKKHVESHIKIVNFTSDLLYIATENWGLYAVFCPLLAFLWALVVAEPKVASKRRFAERKKARIGSD